MTCDVSLVAMFFPFIYTTSLKRTKISKANFSPLQMVRAEYFPRIKEQIAADLTSLPVNFILSTKNSVKSVLSSRILSNHEERIFPRIKEQTAADQRWLDQQPPFKAPVLPVASCDSMLAGARYIKSKFGQIIMRPRKACDYCVKPDIIFTSWSLKAPLFLVGGPLGLLTSSFIPSA